MVAESASDRTATPPARNQFLDDTALLLMDRERPAYRKDYTGDRLR